MNNYIKLVRKRLKQNFNKIDNTNFTEIHHPINQKSQQKLFWWTNNILYQILRLEIIDFVWKFDKTHEKFSKINFIKQITNLFRSSWLRMTYSILKACTKYFLKHFSKNSNEIELNFTKKKLLFFTVKLPKISTYSSKIYSEN